MGTRKQKLALYHYRSCRHCERVRSVIERRGLTVEFRDIRDESGQWRDDLVLAQGSKRVPVLRIEQSDGTVEWVPDSHQIVRYLPQAHGDIAVRDERISKLASFAPWPLLAAAVVAPDPLRTAILGLVALAVVAQFAFALRG